MVKKTVTNTTQQAKDNPELFLLQAAVMGSSGAIEAQEARGQNEFVNSETLPTDLGGKWGRYDAKAILEKAGVKFLGPVEGDPLFQYVELPAGWKKQATDHSMHSDLLDEKGRKRAGVFYKAAFYDRSAHLSLNCRYTVRRDWEAQDKKGLAVAMAVDGDTIIFSTEPVKLPKERDLKYYDIGDAAAKAAGTWLTEKYPDWENPGAYWE